MKNDILTFDEANRLFTYDPFTGELRWSDNEEDLNCYKRNNAARMKGKSITSTHVNGYIQVQVNKKGYLVHRVAWLMCWEEWPRFQIDHIDGNRSNNKISNLRDVPSLENQKNQKIHSTNRSGVTGVRKKGHERFEATIFVNGKRLHLGVFKTLEDAASARKKANEKYGFHKNHGAVR